MVAWFHLRLVATTTGIRINPRPKLNRHFRLNGRREFVVNERPNEKRLGCHTTESGPHVAGAGYAKQV
jgi:hypothetical protein